MIKNLLRSLRRDGSRPFDEAPRGRVLKRIRSAFKGQKIPILPRQFDSSCNLKISPAAKVALEKGTLSLVVKRSGPKAVISNFTLDMRAERGTFEITVCDDDAEVLIAEGCSGKWTLKIFRLGKVHIGKNTSCNRARLICDNSEIRIGEDCMLSDEIILQSADQHGIVDIPSGKIVNQGRKSIVIGDHVWIGRRANLLHGTLIGNGAIIGLGALVNSEIPNNSLAVGVPAKVVRRDVTWCREANSLDDYSGQQIALGEGSE